MINFSRWTSAFELTHFGRVFFHSTITLVNEETRCELEMLTTLVACNTNGLNDRHQPLPAAILIYDPRLFNPLPSLLKLSHALRHGELMEYEFFGSHFALMGENVILHTLLTNEVDGARLADFTAKRILPASIIGKLGEA